LSLRREGLLGAHRRQSVEQAKNGAARNPDSAVDPVDRKGQVATLDRAVEAVAAFAQENGRLFDAD